MCIYIYIHSSSNDKSTMFTIQRRQIEMHRNIYISRRSFLRLGRVNTQGNCGVVKCDFLQVNRLLMGI